MKKLLNLTLIGILLLSVSAVSFANSSNDNESIDTIQSSCSLNISKVANILEVARDSNSYPELLAVPNVDIGEALKLYEAKDGGLTDANFAYYPVIANDKVIGMITARNTENGETFLEYSTFLVDIINEYYIGNEELCLVADYDSLWLVDEDETIKVYTDGFIDETKDIFTNNKRNTIELNGITKSTDNITFVTTASTRDNNNTVIGTYGLAVPRELQIVDGIEDTQFCWACTAVCIGDYCKSVNLDPVDVAIEYAGDLLTPKPITTIIDILQDKYNISSSYVSQPLRMRVVQNNIYTNRTPIGIYVRYSNTTGHFAVVYGYNVESTDITTDECQSVLVMDSLVGYRTINVPPDGTYSREIIFTSAKYGTQYEVTMYLEVD